MTNQQGLDTMRLMESSLSSDINNNIKLPSNLPASQHSTSLVAVGETGISFETKSDIQLMEVDSLENVLQKVSNDSPENSASKNYLEWRETLTCTARPRKKLKLNFQERKVKNKRKRGAIEDNSNSSSESSCHGRNSSDDEQMADARKADLEEFGLETLEEPDYHDSECDVDTQNCIKENIDDLEYDDKNWIVSHSNSDAKPLEPSSDDEVMNDFIIIEATNEDSGPEQENLIQLENPDRIEIIEISELDQMYELDDDGDIVTCQAEIKPHLKIMPVIAEPSEAGRGGILREPSESTMSDSENSIAVKAFLHTVHCTPKLRLVEDINKNKLLITEPLETIDEENTDELQNDLGLDYDELDDFWEEDRDQQLNNPQQLYLFNDRHESNDPETDKLEVKLKESQPEFSVPDHRLSQRVTTAAEELLLNDILDDFVRPPSPSLLIHESNSNLNLSGLEFSDVENTFVDDNHDNNLICNRSTKIRDIWSETDQDLFGNAQTNEIEEEFSDCEENFDNNHNLVNEVNEFSKLSHEDISNVKEHEDDDNDDTFSDALHDLTETTSSDNGLRKSKQMKNETNNQIVIENKSKINVKDDFSSTKIVKSSNKSQQNLTAQSKTTILKNIESQIQQSSESPPIINNHQSRSSLKAQSEMSTDNILIQNSKMIQEQSKEYDSFHMLSSPEFQDMDDDQVGPEGEQMESEVSISEVEQDDIPHNIGDSRWNNMDEYVNILHVKILPDDSLDSSSLDETPLERIIPFPLHKDDVDSAMVLAINSHLPQLHGHYLMVNESYFKFPRTTGNQKKSLMGIIKIQCPLSIPVSFKMNSVSSLGLDMTPDIGIILPHEIVCIQIHCRLYGKSEKDLMEQLKIEGILIYSAPFIFNREFYPENLELKDVREFWEKLQGPRFRFVQTRFIPIEITDEPKSIKEASTRGGGGLLNFIWKLLSSLNIFKYPPAPKTHLITLSSADLKNTQVSPIGQVILRRHINIFRLLQSRVEHLNDYRTMLIMGTLVCAVGIALFYFLIYKPEMVRAQLLSRISSNFWEHCKCILSRLLWAQSQSLQKV